MGIDVCSSPFNYLKEKKKKIQVDVFCMREEYLLMGRTLKRCRKTVDVSFKWSAKNVMRSQSVINAIMFAKWPISFSLQNSLF